MDDIVFWVAFVGIGVLLVLLAAAGGNRRRLRVREAAAGAFGGCGGCGYDLTGLPGNTCPECGSDLTLVGRLSPRFRFWLDVPVTARLIIWTVGVLVLGLYLSATAVVERLPWRQPVTLTAGWSFQGWGLFPRYDPGTSGPILVRQRDVVVSIKLDASDVLLPMRGFETMDLPHSPFPPRYLNRARTITLMASSRGEAGEGVDSGVPGWGMGVSQMWLERVADAWFVRDLSLTRGATVPQPVIDSPITLHDAVHYLLADAAVGISMEYSPDTLANEVLPLVIARLEGGASPVPPLSGWLGWGVEAAPHGWPHPSPLPAALAGLNWFAVWLAGLPFVLRRRTIRVAGAAAEAHHRAPVSTSLADQA